MGGRVAQENVGVEVNDRHAKSLVFSYLFSSFLHFLIACATHSASQHRATRIGGAVVKTLAHLGTSRNMGTPKRSSGRLTRKRVMSARVREVDEGTLANARAKELAALEDDAAPEVSSDSEFELDNEDEIARPRPTKRARRASGGERTKRKGIARHNMPLQQILEKERDMQLPAGMVKYGSLETKDSGKKARKLCSVCGYAASYTCARCRVHFCCLRCSKIHSETRCLKFTVG